jgi:hypothetical protein
VFFGIILSTNHRSRAEKILFLFLHIELVRWVNLRWVNCELLRLDVMSMWFSNQTLYSPGLHSRGSFLVFLKLFWLPTFLSWRGIDLTARKCN